MVGRFTFAAAVMTTMLWISLAFFRATSPQLRIFVCGLGIHGALQGGQWALRNLLPSDLRQLRRVIHVHTGQAATLIMLALWCYALTRPSSIQTGDIEPNLDDA